MYANDGHIESRRIFKRLTSEESKGLRSGYERDYKHALEHLIRTGINIEIIVSGADR